MPSAHDILLDAVEKIKMLGTLALLGLSAMLILVLAQNSCASTEETEARSRSVPISRLLCVYPGEKILDRDHLSRILGDYKQAHLKLDEVLKENKACRPDEGKEELDLSLNCQQKSPQNCDRKLNVRCCPTGTILIPIPSAK